MKCIFVLDVDTDVEALDDAHAAKVQFRRNPGTADQADEYFPAGTELDHPDAWKFVDFGMAIPSDSECEAKAKPLSKQARAKLERDYKATSLGIHDPADRKLYFAGVIAGYQTLTAADGLKTQAYLPGPNYAQWKAQQDAQKAKEESDV